MLALSCWELCIFSSKYPRPRNQPECIRFFTPKKADRYHRNDNNNLSVMTTIGPLLWQSDWGFKTLVLLERTPLTHLTPLSSRPRPHPRSGCPPTRLPSSSFKSGTGVPSPLALPSLQLSRLLSGLNFWSSSTLASALGTHGQPSAKLPSSVSACSLVPPKDTVSWGLLQLVALSSLAAPPGLEVAWEPSFPSLLLSRCSRPLSENPSFGAPVIRRGCGYLATLGDVPSSFKISAPGSLSLSQQFLPNARWFQYP